jgi:hypothetical protein
VRAALHERSLLWRGRDHYSYDRTLLRLANTHGCIVSMKTGTPWLYGKALTWPHSIILTRYDANEVEFYCPNNPEQLWRKTRQWFDGNWRGNSMVFSP